MRAQVAASRGECWRWLVVPVVCALLGRAATAGDAALSDDARHSGAMAELSRLESILPKFKVTHLPQRQATVELKKDDSFTVDDLRGIAIDDQPPVLGDPPRPYHKTLIDGLPPGTGPYIAADIEPFRLGHFDCVLDYGGAHNRNMNDYAVAHGFNTIRDWQRKPAERMHLPQGTRRLSAGPGIAWDRIVPGSTIPPGRLDLFSRLCADRDVVGTAVGAGKFSGSRGYDAKMIDIEHPCLTSDQLREQDWYPIDADEPTRAAFERRYYDGYAKSYTVQVEAARRQRWRNIGVYGWQPIERRWWKLPDLQADLASDWRWNAYGKQIYESVDVVHPSVYCFYWSSANVAYTLAMVDLNRRALAGVPDRKPILPYYWGLLHGGGGGERWWTALPIPREEVRAMIALGFFTGHDGFVLWGWSGKRNHHKAPTDFDEMLGGDDNPRRPVFSIKEGFDATQVNGTGRVRVRRYDAVRVVGYDADTGEVRFRIVDPALGPRGTSDDQPVYAMPGDALAAHLRVPSEPVSAAIEGMALVKPVEFILRYGRIQIDVPAGVQFSQNLPVVRRVSLGDLHVIGTYDPGVIYGGQRRTITLDDFDGRTGLTLRLPADDSVRVFVVDTSE